MLLPVTAFISPGGGELIMIMLVLILLFGAKDAPRIFRTIHTLLNKLQRAAADFRYKIMYGDLHSGTTNEEPYDVAADYSDADSGGLHEGGDPESDAKCQTSEGGDQKSETENGDDEKSTS